MTTDINSLERFCNSWLKKARNYDTRNLNDSFDKFVTTYLVFNRIYTEVGFLIRRKNVSQVLGRQLSNDFIVPRKSFAPLPDRMSATKHVVHYYGETKLQKEISENSGCRRAVMKLVDFVEQGRFYFHEDYNTGLPDARKDRRLASESKQYAPEAILSIIYQARCNLFHGQKEFIASQRVLLIQLSTLLEFITLRIFKRLLTDLKKMYAAP